MAENKKRSIQFRRNISTIFTSSDAVKTAIIANKDEYLDGEQIFGRYYYTEGEVQKVATLVGLVYVKTNEDGTREVTITFDDSHANDGDILAISGKSVGDVQIEQVTSGKTHQYSDADADYYEVTATTLSGGTQVDSFQLTYTPYSPSGLTVPTTIGDIEKGTKASELNGETLSKLLDDIIFPTKYPVITNPTASLVFSDTNNTSTKTVKIGTTYFDLKSTYTKGKATISDGVSLAKYYTGDYVNTNIAVSFTGGSTANTSVDSSYMSTPTTPTFTYTSGSSSVVATATNTTPAGYASAYSTGTTASKLDKLGTYKFKSTISYAAGDEMITSKSAHPGTPLRYESLNGTANNTQAPYKTVTNPNPASTIATSETCQINVTLPVFATTANTTTFAELQLIPWGATGNSTSDDSTNSWRVTFPDTSKTSPVKIKSPRKLNAVNAFNPTSNKYDVTLLTSFKETTTTETVNGVSYGYYLYTWDGAVTASGKYKITWK